MCLSLLATAAHGQPGQKSRVAGPGSRVNGGRETALTGAPKAEPVIEWRQPRAMAPGLSAPPQIRGAATLLIDVQTGEPLAALDADRRMFPASLTKLMTAILAAERLAPDTVVTVAPEAAAVGETSLGLKAGQTVTVNDLLCGAVMKSANDAAAELACQMAGSQAKFAGLMNQRAAAMGLRGTHFVNPHGLQNAAHYTTAADLARIGQWFLHYPILREICGQQYTDLASLTPGTPQRIQNQNRLLKRWNECIGCKTGYTRQAGNCIVAAARRNGWVLLCVVLNSRDVWTDSRSLLEWGFSNYCPVAPAAGLGSGCQVPVLGGARASVAACPGPAAGLVLPKGHNDWQLEVHPQPAHAPVAIGQTVGYALLTVAGKPAQRVPLLAAEAVSLPELAGWRVPRGTGWALLLSLGMVVLYGAAAKNLSARRLRIPAGSGAADLRGPGDPRWPDGDGPRPAGRPRAQPRARRRAHPASPYQLPLPAAQQTRGVPDREK